MMSKDGTQTHGQLRTPNTLPGSAAKPEPQPYNSVRSGNLVGARPDVKNAAQSRDAGDAALAAHKRKAVQDGEVRSAYLRQQKERQ
jgi:hypothetical protein